MGVYSAPDPRYPDRTVYEAWDDRGRCLAVSSVLTAEADAATEAALWSWLDERTDVRLTASGERPSRRPSHLRPLAVLATLASGVAPALTLLV